MKGFARNYVLNYFFLPLLLAAAVSAVFVYQPEKTTDEILLPGLLQILGMTVLSAAYLSVLLLIGHLGSTLFVVESARTQHLMKNLGSDTREKVFSIFPDKSPSVVFDAFRPFRYYLGAFLLALFALLGSSFLLYFTAYNTPPLWVVEALKITTVLLIIVQWVWFNLFKAFMERSLKTIKRFSDRCLYYSSENLLRSQIFNTITNVVRIFNEEQNLEPVFRKILDDCIRLLDLDAAGIEIYLDEITMPKKRVIAPAETSIQLDEDFGELVIGRSEVHNNIQLSRLFRPLADQGVYSLLHVTLEVRGRDVGYMAGFSKKKRDLRDADLDFFYTFGQQASMVVENVYLLEKVKILSVTDGLTGLHNYRYFKEAMANEVRRAVRYRKSLCVVMIDIDHFKDYNDTNGHPAGDVVLQKTAKILIELTRDTDIVARYGGEEFVLVLTETTKKGGEEFARRLCSVIEKDKFENEEAQPGGNLTASLGVASCPDDSSDPAELVNRADQALYKAKETGRNRVCVYGKS